MVSESIPFSYVLHMFHWLLFFLDFVPLVPLPLILYYWGKICRPLWCRVSAPSAKFTAARSIVQQLKESASGTCKATRRPHGDVAGSVRHDNRRRGQGIAAYVEEPWRGQFSGGGRVRGSSASAAMTVRWRRQRGLDGRGRRGSVAMADAGDETTTPIWSHHYRTRLGG